MPAATPPILCQRLRASQSISTKFKNKDTPFLCPSCYREQHEEEVKELKSTVEILRAELTQLKEMLCAFREQANSSTNAVPCCSKSTRSGGSGRGGGGQRRQWHPPFRKKNLHAYFLTINNPALAILLSSSRLEDIRGPQGLATLQITHTKRLIIVSPTPLLHELIVSTKCKVQLEWEPILPKYVPDASKATLGALKLQNFPGGACPQTPLEWAALLPLVACTPL